MAMAVQSAVSLHASPSATPSHAGRELVAPADAWLALTRDTDCGVIIIAASGAPAACNESARSLLRPEAPPGDAAAAIAPVIHGSGANLPDLSLTSLGKLILLHVGRVLHGPRPVLLRETHAGLPIRIVLRRSRCDGHDAVVVCTLSPRLSALVTASDAALYDVVEGKPRAESPLAALTESELRVLRLIAEGMSTADIAQAVHRSSKTIEWHRASLGKKLGVKTRVQLAKVAIQYGLVTIPGAVSAAMGHASRPVSPELTTPITRN
ncbi:hypothetical protein BH11PLA1_BH11PLA1_23210 [soil metagenome]